MIRLLPLVALLAACGIDGAPISPAEAEKKERESQTTVPPAPIP